MSQRNRRNGNGALLSKCLWRVCRSGWTTRCRWKSPPGHLTGHPPGSPPIHIARNSSDSPGNHIRDPPGSPGRQWRWRQCVPRSIQQFRCRPASTWDSRTSPACSDDWCWCRHVIVVWNHVGICRRQRTAETGGTGGAAAHTQSTAGLAHQSRRLHAQTHRLQRYVGRRRMTVYSVA